MSSPRRVVADSSVAVKWFVADNETDVDAALALLSQHVAGTQVITAPGFLLFEVLNVLKNHRYPPGKLEDAADRLHDAHLELVPVELLARRAGAIAAEYDLTVYDAAFVALAESLDAELVTADRRLVACTACKTRLLGA